MSRQQEYYFNEHDENQVQKKYKSNQRLKVKRRIKILFVLLVFILVGTYFISDYSRISKISIQGCQEVKQEDVLKTMTLKKGDIILFVNTNKIYRFRLIAYVVLPDHIHCILKPKNIYDYSNNLETSYNTPIAEYNKYEYKHYNCSKMINLEKYFEIELNEILPYSKLIEKESEEETINIFKTYITRFINIQEEDEILFLFKKYKVNYDTSVISVTLDGSEKTYKLKYKFTLL